MRGYTIIALVAVLLTVAAVEAKRDVQPLLTEKFVAEVNRKANGKWVASAKNGHLVTGATKEQVKRLLGVKKRGVSVLSKRVASPKDLKDGIPSAFQSSEQWPSCPTITRISDQSSCGSCWAMSVTGAISDRLCTYAGVQDAYISGGELLSCCTACGDGCDGGYPEEAWKFFVDYGLVSEYCQPYPFPRCSHHDSSAKYPPCNGDYDTPACNATCTDDTIPVIKYFGSAAYTVAGVQDLQNELLQYGPLEVAFDVYEDFLSYKSGIYQHVSGEYEGGHAVRLVGWGVDNGTPYWTIANSWNEDWGENGYFRIIRGQDECGIESEGTAGLPTRRTSCV